MHTMSGDQLVLTLGEGPLGLDLAEDDGGNFVLTSCEGQASDGGAQAGDFVVTLNGIDIAEFDLELARKTLQTAPRPFFVLLRRGECALKLHTNMSLDEIKSSPRGASPSPSPSPSPSTSSSPLPLPLLLPFTFTPESLHVLSVSLSLAC